MRLSGKDVLCFYLPVSLLGREATRSARGCACAVSSVSCVQHDADVPAMVISESLGASGSLTVEEELAAAMSWASWVTARQQAEARKCLRGKR